MLGLFDFLRRTKAKKSPKLSPRQVRGREGERAAEKFLRREGHRIIARNVTFRQGEVDLVAVEKRTGTIVFVEVRGRDVSDGGQERVSPEESVTPAKRRRVISASKKFLMDHRLTGAAVRFDVVTVRFTDAARRVTDVRHYPGAFDVHGKLL